MSATVAILGAGGFIGNRCVEIFHLGTSYEVRPIVRRACSLALASRFPLDGYVADARDQATLTQAFAGCDVVVHAIAGDPRTIVDSVAPAYHAAAEAGVRRLIYLSSAAVHGQSPAPGTDETSPLNRRQKIAYNNAKIAAEQRLHELRDGGDVEVVRLRPGIVHGPRSQWIGGFADTLLTGQAYLVDGGRGICNSIYVDNLVEAIRLAIETPAADGEAYIVGDEETITWADLCGPIAEALGYDPESLAVPTPSTDFAQRLSEPLSALARRVIHRLPARGRRVIRAARAAWRTDGPDRALPKAPTVTAEIAALHTCQVRLPMEKARRELQYTPIVPFEAACRHSIAWLAFAGYPVVGGVPGDGALPHPRREVELA